MPDDFIIARNPEPDSTLPYLVRIPLGTDGVVLKVKDTWPRTAKIYCHRAHEWPADAEIIERTPTRVCTSRGAAIDLVLDRGRENRSQFVITRARGRQMIFWQSPRTTKQARPNVRLPTARAAAVASEPGGIEILVDSHERYAWRFSTQQVTTRTIALPAGDYAVQVDETVVAAVERKSLADLSHSLFDGTLRYAAAELAGLPRAAIVVEDRYSKVFDLAHVRGAKVADAIAECQARHPSVPIIFAENRKLAQEWTYRFLAAARAEVSLLSAGERALGELAAAGPVPEGERTRTRARAASAKESPDAAHPAPSLVRAWAVAEGLPVADRGRIRPAVYAAYAAAHGHLSDRKRLLNGG